MKKNTHSGASTNVGSAVKLIFYSSIIGVVSGLGAVVFYYLLKLCTYIFLVKAGDYTPPSINELTGVVSPLQDYLCQQMFTLHTGIHWYLALIPAIGGLIVGFIVYTWAPEAEGHGTDAAIEAFHQHRGIIRPRVPFIKTIASAITIGSGGSAGREGPIAQIGAGFGSYLASRLGLTDKERRIMMTSGIGGGIGSIFRAPLGGALFAIEVLYSETEIEYEAIIPAVIASIVGYSVFASIVGWGALFHTPDFTFNNPLELIVYFTLAGVCVVSGYVYVKVFYGMRDKFFKRISCPPHIKPAIGGLLLGCIALFYPQVLGSGYGWVQLAIYGKMAIGLMLVLALAKILATSFTISSGGSGGVFAPSLVIGAMLGGAFGGIAHQFFPGLVLQPSAYVLVGMAGFFAGVANAPISTLIMVCELTGSYGLLPPLMLVCVTALLFSRGFTIYEKQVPTRIDSPAHRGEFIINVLERLKVRDAISVPGKISTVSETTTLKEIIRLISLSQSSYFPVVNSAGNMTGIFDIHDVRRLLTEEFPAHLVIAKDIAIKEVITVNPDEDLNSVLRKFTLKDLEELPVVNPEDPMKVIDMISRKDLINTYNNAII
ncbi:MAG: chloride channel protein [Syntrophobacterales bacterium]|nr:chloride channel protein [Syntrophobacterales bacterium]